MARVNKSYFIYRHIRADKNEPFYIGRGTTYERERKTNIKLPFSIVGKYGRAFCKSRRNSMWNKVVKKTDYSVDIIYESDSIEEIIKKETEFIKLYGRKDLKNGTLVNCSYGNDGVVELGQDSIERIKIGQKKSGMYEKMREERVLPINIYDTKGGYIKTCKDKYECALYLKCSASTINNYIYDKMSINDFIICREYSPEGIDISEYRIYRPKAINIEKVNKNGEVIAIFKSKKQAVEMGGGNLTGIHRSIKNNKPVKGILWRKAEVGFKLKQP